MKLTREKINFFFFFIKKDFNNPISSLIPNYERQIEGTFKKQLVDLIVKDIMLHLLLLLCTNAITFVKV